MLKIAYSKPLVAFNDVTILYRATLRFYRKFLRDNVLHFQR